MTEEYTIHLVIDLKKTTSLEDIKNLLRDSATNLNCQQEYFTYETEGMNNIITKNNLIYVTEFNKLENLEKYIEFIRSISKVKIELLCNNDKIIYMSRQYKKSLDNNIIDSKAIESTIEKYRKDNKYNHLYKLLY